MPDTALFYDSDTGVLRDGDGPIARGHAIQSEGEPVPPQATLDFEGPGVTVTDDPDADRTVITFQPPGAWVQTTQDGYEALTSPDAGTLYVIVPEVTAPTTVAQWAQVTQAEYDGLTPDLDTLYVIVG